MRPGIVGQGVVVAPFISGTTGQESFHPHLDRVGPFPSAGWIRLVSQDHRCRWRDATWIAWRSNDALAHRCRRSRLYHNQPRRPLVEACVLYARKRAHGGPLLGICVSTLNSRLACFPTCSTRCTWMLSDPISFVPSVQADECGAGSWFHSCTCPTHPSLGSHLESSPRNTPTGSAMC